MSRRLIHSLVALVLLIAVSPIVIVALVVTACCYRGNPFFLQSREGLHGKPFRIWKIRTLDRAKKPIRFVGEFLRQWHLDELLQLVNVIKGDMRIVGPRATAVDWAADFRQMFGPEAYNVRLLVPPGITGRAQRQGLPHVRKGNRPALDEDTQFVFLLLGGGWRWVVEDVRECWLTIDYFFNGEMQEAPAMEATQEAVA